MDQPVQGFFAYPSQPVDRAETIETAIELINQSGTGVVHVTGWKSLLVGGKFIVEQVCGQIDSCDVFLCDVTTLNVNVLFELGYAIAKNKRVWIVLDSGFDLAKSNYERLRLLTTVGYTEYQNARQISDRFHTTMPYRDLDSTIYRSLVNSITAATDRVARFFYLQSEVKSEASRRILHRLGELEPNLVYDDPGENSSQPLSWYAVNVFCATGILIHLLSENQPDRTSQNARYSFVAGMAYGFQKPLLMLAHDPFSSPLDYRDLLKVHVSAAMAVDFLEEWHRALVKQRAVLSGESKDKPSPISQIEYAVGLKDISLGEDIAENEQQDLSQYYVETRAYQEALRSPQSMIYVGRKGSGKTANLFAIAARLRSDPENHVCVIRPVSYELEGVADLITSIERRSEQGFFVESLWKYLIYTELALSVHAELETRPIHSQLTEAEIEFERYFASNSGIFSTEFSVRLDNAIARFHEENLSTSVGQKRLKISELLHAQLLSELRGVLGKVLSKKRRVCILIDNLDKPWARGSNVAALSSFLFGLLSVSRAISEEFGKKGLTWQQVNLTIFVFLRSDIFAQILFREARERDKLVFQRLSWDDPQLLLRVVEERFRYSWRQDSSNSYTDVWSRFFAPSIRDIPIKEFLLSRIIPRPRDIIYLCRQSLSYAASHQHQRIEPDDILRAERDYSQYAFNSLEAELSILSEHFEAMLVEFVGCQEIVTMEEVLDCAQRALIGADKTLDFVEALVDFAFLGLEKHKDEFEFVYDESRKTILEQLAEKTVAAIGVKRFRINPAYHSYLEIRSIPA